MAILTIDDLKKATPKQVEDALAGISILGDLQTYREWLLRNRQQVDIQFSIGGEDRSLGLHPSSLSKVGGCPLKLQWEITGEVEPIESFSHDMEDTYDIGTAYHKMLQATLHSMYGEQFQSEVKLSIPELMLTGSADGLFTFSGYRFLLEIKTAKEGDSQYGFNALSKKPLADHVRQVTPYMKGLNVPFALLFYFCKNNSMKIEHVVKYDGVVWEELRAVAEPIIKAVESGVRVQPKPGFDCQRCQFLHGCDAGKGRNNADEKSSRRWSGKGSR